VFIANLAFLVLDEILGQLATQQKCVLFDHKFLDEIFHSRGAMNYTRLSWLPIAPLINFYRTEKSNG